MITAADFIGARARIEGLRESKDREAWLERAAWLVRWERTRVYYLVSSVTAAGSKLERVTWFLAEDRSRTPDPGFLSIAD